MEKTRGSTDGRADKGAVARYMVEYVFIPVLLLYNVEFLSTVRQGASALQVHSSTPIRVPPRGPPQSPEYSSLWSTVASHCLSFHT